MTRGQVRRRLSVNWWQYLALALVPLFVINGVFGQSEAILPVLAMPLFIAGVASMFVSLKFFGGYKHALIATQKALDTPEEPAAWIALAAKTPCRVSGRRPACLDRCSGGIRRA